VRSPACQLLRPVILSEAGGDDPPARWSGGLTGLRIEGTGYRAFGSGAQGNRADQGEQSGYRITGRVVLSCCLAEDIQHFQQSLRQVMAASAVAACREAAPPTSIEPGSAFIAGSALASNAGATSGNTEKGRKHAINPGHTPACADADGVTLSLYRHFTTKEPPS